MKSSRQDILGQLLMVRLDENRWTASRERFLRAAQPAGVLLAAPLPSSAASTSELLRKIASSLPHLPLLAVREEGGTHDPLCAFCPAVPSPHAAAQKGPSTVERLGELLGEALSFLGFNTNFAPLLDLAMPFTGKTLGARTFGADPRHVAECGGAFLRGFERHKVLACGKHFPGLGSVPPGDSREIPVIGKSMAALWREDLFPYRRLLSQLPMVLVSPAAYKAYDFDRPRPASLSPQVVEGLLRIKLGYGGLALAYELESEAVRGTLDLGEAAVQSLNAGCDLLVLNQERSCEVVCRAVKNGLEAGKLSSRRVEQALSRIHAVRRKLTPPTGKVSKAALEQLLRRFESFAKEFRREELRIA
ncbi:MAG: hypothetical protein LAO07_15800, partial [Acidobacteriia bacterium]|nr:hypothetical protein [Terriglobia bacterium]